MLADRGSRGAPEPCRPRARRAAQRGGDGRRLSRPLRAPRLARLTFADCDRTTSSTSWSSAAATASAARSRKPSFAAKPTGLPVHVELVRDDGPAGSGPALPEALELAPRLRPRPHGSHRSHPLAGQDLSAADLVIGFEPIHISTAVVGARARRERTFLITELVAGLEESPPQPESSVLERARAAVREADEARKAAPGAAREIARPDRRPVRGLPADRRRGVQPHQPAWPSSSSASPPGPSGRSRSRPPGSGRARSVGSQPIARSIFPIAGARWNISSVDAALEDLVVGNEGELGCRSP